MIQNEIKAHRFVPEKRFVDVRGTFAIAEICREESQRLITRNVNATYLLNVIIENQKFGESREEPLKAYQAFLELAALGEELFLTYSSGPLKQKSDIAWRGYDMMQEILAKANVASSIKNDLQEIIDATANYGTTIMFEFSKRNLGVDPLNNGTIIFRDILFDLEKIYHENLSRKKRK